MFSLLIIIALLGHAKIKNNLELSLEMMLSDERAQKSDRYLALTKTPSEQTKTSSLVLLRRTTSESKYSVDYCTLFV